MHRKFDFWRFWLNLSKRIVHNHIEKLKFSTFKMLFWYFKKIKFKPERLSSRSAFGVNSIDSIVLNLIKSRQFFKKQSKYGLFFNLIFTQRKALVAN